MLPDMVRRISAVLLTLALVFGPAVSGANAYSMGAKMTVAASSDTHWPSKCDGCGTAKAGMLAGVCSAAFCNGLTTFPSAGNAVFALLQADTLAPYDSPDMSGHTAAPDPYPPRPTILS